MAIGSTQPKPDSSDHLIAARWNGLSSVSCAAPGQCLAVGLSSIRTLAAAWKGRTWRVIKTLNP